MKLYRITLTGADGEAPSYRAQREHARMKAQQAVDYRESRIERIEINPGADEIVDMLNGTYTFAQTVSPLETWGLTAGGALREVPNGE